MAKNRKNVIQNRMTQATFCVLSQIAAKPELRDKMVEGLKNTDFLEKVPPTMKYSVIVPDRPVSAVKTQEMSLKEILGFFSQKAGSEFIAKPVSFDLKSLVENPDDDRLVERQKQNAVNVLTHIARQLVKEIRKADVSEKYLDKARRSFEEVIVHPKGDLSLSADRKKHIKRGMKALKALAFESEDFSEKLDGVSAAHLFYNRNRNEVLKSGFSPAPFDNKLSKVTLPNDAKTYFCPEIHDKNIVSPDQDTDSPGMSA